MSTTYAHRRGEIETYFDRTAAATWQRLTSDAPVSGIRATVRAGRDRMRATLLSWLPADLNGLRILDAGCGTGALAVEAARRGAEVVAIDLSPTLVAIARERAATETVSGRIDFRSGDMLDPALGRFDHIVAMDSVIHYALPDLVAILAGFSGMADTSVLFTHAPGTPLLLAMKAVGKLFPRGDRSPAIVPHAHHALERALAAEPRLDGFRQGRETGIRSGFYISHARELVRA